MIRNTIAILFTLCCLNVQAQDSDRQARFEANLQETRARLALTPEQEEALKPILRSQFEAQAETLNKYGLEPGMAESGERPSFFELRKMRKEMQGIMESHEKQIAGVLSKDQMTTYEELREERRKAMRERIQSQR